MKKNSIIKAVLVGALTLAALSPLSAKAKKTGRTVAEIKKSKTIKIAVFSDKKPFGYVDENGEYQGYDVYFGNRIAKDLGVKVKYVPVEAAARVEVLATGKVDLVLANFNGPHGRPDAQIQPSPYNNDSEWPHAARFSGAGAAPPYSG